MKDQDKFYMLSVDAVLSNLKPSVHVHLESEEARFLVV
jgi:hypothetical protein